MAGGGDRSAGAIRLERLVVTRPAPEAATWVSALREQGWPAHALPLIQITEPPSPDDLATLHHWRTHWAQADAILFVSTAAVQHFFARGVSAPPASSRTRFWAPGPGTARQLAQALAAMGLPVGRIDAPDDDAGQFDSEHLWPRVRSQVGPGRTVLIVRGASTLGLPPADPPGVPGSGRGWLIEQCVAAGAQVQGCVAYARQVPVLSADEQAWVDSATGEDSAWLFSSSEALLPLHALQPTRDWSHAGALATHPRIATAARQAGFGRVVQTRPTLPDVVRALESGWTRP
ncbi:uroporphyrinogen-III synthase [Hydrogenophaga sp.]|uniref:uroporphyrinogen-III synthase n=1 Tax=Hydrogenophaga sp. TaxID=1904254 RepID=UPI0026370FA1|nr:uroporphyrinogen-III synthase [Hydrogenophaga sp.]